METRYFEYSVNPADGKYTEVSEEQFITDVINSENRFFIPMGTVVFECGENEYRKYRKERNRRKYLKQMQREKGIRLVQVDDDIRKIPALDYSEEELVEHAYMSVQKEKLRKALQMLDEDERRLIDMRYYLEMKQEEIGKIIGKTQQAVSYDIGIVLNKLHKLLKN